MQGLDILRVSGGSGHFVEALLIEVVCLAVLGRRFCTEFYGLRNLGSAPSDAFSRPGFVIVSRDSKWFRIGRQALRLSGLRLKSYLSQHTNNYLVRLKA